MCVEMIRIVIRYENELSFQNKFTTPAANVRNLGIYWRTFITDLQGLEPQAILLANKDKNALSIL